MAAPMMDHAEELRHSTELYDLSSRGHLCRSAATSAVRNFGRPAWPSGVSEGVDAVQQLVDQQAVGVGDRQQGRQGRQLVPPLQFRQIAAREIRAGSHVAQRAPSLHSNLAKAGTE